VRDAALVLLVLVLFAEGCLVIWYVYENSKVYGGWLVSNASSLTSCRQACDQNSTCSAFDFDVAQHRGYRCFLHVASSDEFIYVGAARGVRHFSRRVSCGLLFNAVITSLKH